MTLSFRQVPIAGSGIYFALTAMWMGAPQFILLVWRINDRVLAVQWKHQLNGSLPETLVDRTIPLTPGHAATRRRQDQGAELEGGWPQLRRWLWKPMD
jgi:hypothetical protein